MKKTIPEISYELAPPGSPDKFRLTADAHFIWSSCPRWIWALVAKRCVRLDSGYIVAYMEEGRRVLHACIFTGFYFAVSVAPSYKRAIGPACLHDWIYANASALASAWGARVRTVLHIADHFFLALMRATGFLLARSYFCGVRMLGYWFHTLFGKTENAPAR